MTIKERVLEYIKNNGKVYARQIKDDIGMSGVYLSKVIKSFLKDGLITEVWESWNVRYFTFNKTCAKWSRCIYFDDVNCDGCRDFTIKEVVD